MGKMLRLFNPGANMFDNSTTPLLSSGSHFALLSEISHSSFILEPLAHTASYNLRGAPRRVWRDQARCWKIAKATECSDYIYCLQPSLCDCVILEMKQIKISDQSANPGLMWPVKSQYRAGRSSLDLELFTKQLRLSRSPFLLSSS